MTKSGSKPNGLPSLQPFSGLSTTKQFAFSLLSNEQMSGLELNGRTYPKQERLHRADKRFEENLKSQLKGLELTRHNASEAIKNALGKISAGAAPIVPWIEANVYNWLTVPRFQGVYNFDTAELLKLVDYQKDILTVIWTPGADGLYPYSEVVWSQPKKNGKTQIAGAVGAWFSENVEPPNMIYTLASNQEQSSGLIFNALVPSLYGRGGRVPNTTLSVPLIVMPNGTTIRAIPNNYAGQAGGSYGLTLWSELWTYKSERDRRLWEEMPPVPTRKTSVRWVETYAGFQNESDLLIDQFSRVFGTTRADGTRIPDFTERQIQKLAEPVPGLEHITARSGRPSCWHIPSEGFFMFWDDQIRGPWITEKYIKQQKAGNRHSTYVRLWENKWQTSEGTFIEPNLWDDAVTLDGEALGPMTLAGDASQRNDTTALVGVEKYKVKIFGEEQERFRVRLVRVWDPEGRDLDLEETIAAYVERIYKMGLLAGPFRYDPFQMHQVAVNLRKRGVPCVEFNQGQDRLKADTFLWKLFNDRRIDVYNNSVLESHVKGANAKEYENEQVRIVKGTATEANKVDAAVALSMACWAASTRVKRTTKRVKSSSQSIFKS